ncbi:MAG: hypothetical protein JXA33_12500 [Anaerolineae bacterium]|nr:hypothetical protein [Anaerolineae bacterium]
MATGYTRSPKLLKGALVELSEPFLGPVPNVIVFQYNPETMTREFTPWSAEGEDGRWGVENPSAQPFDPNEKFTLTLEFDAADGLEFPQSHPVTAISGIADRLAALEMLLYPVQDKGGLLDEAFATLGGTIKAMPRGSVPVVLFVWGPGRILPVRLTSFSVEEQAFSPTLYPIQAKVTVGMQVLIPESFKKLDKALSASEKLAIAAYKYTRGQKEVLARANLANNVESILGLLPF